MAKSCPSDCWPTVQKIRPLVQPRGLFLTVCSRNGLQRPHYACPAFVLELLHFRADALLSGRGRAGDPIIECNQGAPSVYVRARLSVSPLRLKNLLSLSQGRFEDCLVLLLNPHTATGIGCVYSSFQGNFSLSFKLSDHFGLSEPPQNLGAGIRLFAIL